MNQLTIRPAIPSDWPQLRQAVIELQEHERRLHSTRLPGEQIADAYLKWMQRQAGERGAILVAEIQSAFVGFVAGWIEQERNIAETDNSNRFGYISDICVLPAYRGQRFASRLLDALEQHLRSEGVICACGLALWRRMDRRGQAMNVRVSWHMRLSTRRSPGSKMRHKA